MKSLRNIKKAKYTFILFLVLIFLILTTVVLINKPTIGVGWISSCPHCGSSEINYYSDSEMHNYMCNNCHMGEGYHHVGGSHSNNGVCTTCYYQYQMHTQSNTISKYDTTQTTHIPIYTCFVSGCTATYPGSIEQHLGGTHENGGKCTVCNLPYQTHTQSNTISKYDTTQTTHTPIYTCSVSGCTATYTGSAEQHLGGTHENGGKCTVCNLPYQTHTQSNTISKYDTTQTTHTPIYTCSVSGCTSTYSGSAEQHLGGTHENGGKCTVCNLPYQTHTQSNTISKYNTTQTTHTPIYTCSFSGCTSTYTGSANQHELYNWIDNKNGTHSSSCTLCNYKVTQEHNYKDGKCITCNSLIPTTSCEHAYITKNNDAQHWQVCSKCNIIKPNSLQIHTYSDYIDNKNGTHSSTCTLCNYKVTQEHNYKDGKCITCNSLIPTTSCEHAYITKNDDTQHWQVCSKCNIIKPDSLQIHIYSDYIDNKNGTHSSTCTLCNYKVTQEHNYKDGKCITCNSLIPTTSCEHTYITKNDDTQHWQVCSKCNTLKSNSLQEHSYSNYTDNKNGTHIATCKSCNYQLIEPHPIDGTCTFCKTNGPINNDDANIKNTITDNTIAIGTLPQTGISNIILVSIFMLIIILGIVILKMKQYKDV